jgi:hypothetical protein
VAETENLIQELQSVQVAVNEASEHTKRQLEAINTSLSLEALISILAAFGITYLLKISLYWIPTAFLLIILWGLYSLVNAKMGKKKTLDQNINDFSKVNPIQASAGMEFIIKNVMPAVKALSMLYVISLIVILATIPPWFNVWDVVSYIPILACLILLSMPFAIENLETFFQRGNIEKMINNAKSLQEFGKSFMIKIVFFGVLMLFAFVYGLLLIILPFISLAITYPATVPISENIRLFILVLLLQIMAMVMMARYFNALVVHKELTNTLTNYADIHMTVQYYLLRRQFEQQDVDRVKHLFLTAKRFDVLVDDSMKLCNFYLLIPHRVNIRETATVGDPVSKVPSQGPLLK